MRPFSKFDSRVCAAIIIKATAVLSAFVWYAFFSFEAIGSVWIELAYVVFAVALTRIKSNVLFTKEVLESPSSLSAAYSIFHLLICLRILCLVFIVGFISEGSQSLAIIYIFALQADGYVNQLNLNGAILQRFFGVYALVRLLAMLIGVFQSQFSDALWVFYLGTLIAALIPILMSFNAGRNLPAAGSRLKPLNEAWRAYRLSVVTTSFKELDLVLLASILAPANYSEYKLIRSVASVSCNPAQLIQSLKFATGLKLVLLDRVKLVALCNAVFVVGILLLASALNFSADWSLVFAFICLVACASAWPDLYASYANVGKSGTFSNVLSIFAAGFSIVHVLIYFTNPETGLLFTFSLSLYWFLSHFSLWRASANRERNQSTIL